jgi:hypothetical protein
MNRFVKRFGTSTLFAVTLCLCVTLPGCDKENANPLLKFTFKFDPEQARLNNFGQPTDVPAGNAAQTPVFHSISAHYIELAADENTQLGEGTIVYKSEETDTGGDVAIDFSKSIVVGEGELFFSIPIKEVQAGSYKYIRVSLSYQNYDVVLLVNGFDVPGRVASFLGYNTYITTFTINEKEKTINANKRQGYWAFETAQVVFDGQAPEGATTVPNPIAATSPIPAGSCVVTGEFDSPLKISSGVEDDITVEISLSINNSFEWKESTPPDGKFQPSIGEKVVDMGIRGLIPTIK